MSVAGKARSSFNVGGCHGPFRESGLETIKTPQPMLEQDNRWDWMMRRNHLTDSLNPRRRRSGLASMGKDREVNDRLTDDRDELESESSDSEEADDIDTDDTELAEPVALEEIDEVSSSGADDALGLYLRQMGSIPLLKRPDEVRVAKRLEHARNRFRSAALQCAAL